MAKYILKRAIASFISMIVLITVTFFLMHAVPGSPFNTKELRSIPPNVLESIRTKYGLDLPAWKQYLNYMKNLLSGDLGSSFKTLNYTVNELILGGFPASANIGFWSIVVTLVIGIPLGIAAALRRGGWMDWFSMILATVGVSIPIFIVAMLRMYILGMKLQILPIYGYGTVKHMVIPVICLALMPISYVTRLMRSSMMEVLRQDYILCARARGVPELAVIAKHGVRNSILPVVAYLGPLTAVLLTGGFVVEKLFMIPGMGRYFVSAVSDRDYSLILGLAIFYGALMMLCTLIADIAYAIIDPRVKITE
jgi:oligopeptide transport system permease protein